MSKRPANLLAFIFLINIVSKSKFNEFYYYKFVLINEVRNHSNRVLWLAGQRSYDTDPDSGSLMAQCWQKAQQQQNFENFILPTVFAIDFINGKCRKSFHDESKFYYTGKEMYNNSGIQLYNKS